MNVEKQHECCKRFDSKECEHTGQKHNCEKCVEMLRSYTIVKDNKCCTNLNVNVGR